MKWTYFYLYVILDVFSRYAVGWTVQHREGAQLAKALIAQAAAQQKIPQGQLTVHADRGSSMTSKPVAFLLADLGVTRSHNRPYTSTDNPYSEAHFKTLKYRPEFPRRFENIQQAHAFCRTFIDWYNHQHRHSGIGLMTQPPSTTAAPRTPQPAPARPRRRLHRDTRAIRPPPAPTTSTADRRLDQQTHDRESHSLNSTTKCLIRLDRLRTRTVSTGPR